MANNIIALPRKSRLEIEIDALFQCLPAVSHWEIWNRLMKELGYKIPLSRVGLLILEVRRNPERWGYDIPSGGHGLRALGDDEPRFVAVLVESGKEPYFDPGSEKAVNIGLLSMLLHAASSLEHEAAALKIAVPYYRSTTAGRKMRSLARRIGNLGTEIADVADEIKPNGTD
jgi:hypothetical protein